MNSDADMSGKDKEKCIAEFFCRDTENIKSLATYLHKRFMIAGASNIYKYSGAFTASWFFENFMDTSGPSSINLNEAQERVYNRIAMYYFSDVDWDMVLGYLEDELIFDISDVIP